MSETRPTGLDGRTIVADIETHCPVHCPGCNECPAQQRETKVSDMPKDEMTVIVDGKTIIRSTQGISPTLLQLWRRIPTMMIPDSYEYRPATRDIDLAEL